MGESRGILLDWLVIRLLIPIKVLLQKLNRLAASSNSGIMPEEESRQICKGEPSTKDETKIPGIRESVDD